METATLYKDVIILARWFPLGSNKTNTGIGPSTLTLAITAPLAKQAFIKQTNIKTVKMESKCHYLWPSPFLLSSIYLKDFMVLKGI